MNQLCEEWQEREAGQRRGGTAGDEDEHAAAKAVRRVGDGLHLSAGEDAAWHELDTEPASFQANDERPGGKTAESETDVASGGEMASSSKAEPVAEAK